uniref:Uncharacterized protein n=1 Tax=Cyanophora biloba TaxID=1489483 RepID=A0A2Z4HGH1_9EUKA|nr:hypothetical protein [Cyanophora biloba]AWW13890.1 hypothetical protein [Cyanophora biloba]
MYYTFFILNLINLKKTIFLNKYFLYCIKLKYYFLFLSDF